MFWYKWRAGHQLATSGQSTPPSHFQTSTPWSRYDLQLNPKMSHPSPHLWLPGLEVWTTMNSLLVASLWFSAVYLSVCFHHDQGLYPESHGIVGNTVHDPLYNITFSLDTAEKMHDRWLGGEPVSAPLWSHLSSVWIWNCGEPPLLMNLLMTFSCICVYPPCRSGRLPEDKDWGPESSTGQRTAHRIE